MFVAALGHVYGPNPDRGVYRSRDGGATWQKVLFKSDDVGAIDLAFDPTNSQIVYASLWNTRRPPWSIYPPSYGPGGGIYKSTDGGTNWQAADERPAGRRRRPHRHRGRADQSQPRLRDRRCEGGRPLSLGRCRRDVDQMSGDKRIWGRGWYFGKVVVDPKNADIVYVSNTGVYRSTDGGKTLDGRSKARPAATIITSSGSIRTIRTG